MFSKEHSLYYKQALIEQPDTGIRLQEGLRIYMVLAGQCRLQLKQVNEKLRTDDIFLIPSDAPYAIFSETPSLVLYELTVLPEYFDTFAPALSDMDFKLFHIPCNDHDKIYRQLCHMLAGIVFSSFSSDCIIRLKQLTHINQLVMHIYEQFGTPVKVKESTDDYVHSRMSEALRYIHAHYMDDLSLDQISAHLGLHPQYFSSFFKKHFQMGFLDYVNLYRVNHSLSALQNPSKTILDIALSCGFHSHKTYSNAFKRVYGVLPSQYRAQPQSNADAPLTEENPTAIQYFQKLRTYWERPEKTIEMVPQKSLLLNMDLVHMPTKITDRRIKSISIGSGFFLLQQRAKEQLTRLATECSFEYVHFRDPFSDLLKVYTDMPGREPLYYWDDLDSVLDTIVSLGKYPMIEIGYMPRDLSAESLQLAFSYHPHMSPPKSKELWSGLITSFLKHCISRYGRRQLLHWKFDFWNTPNVQFANGYWSGTQEDFFALYHLTWETFAAVDPNLQLGSPNFSLPGGMDWYESFFAFCKEKHIRPAFLGLHLYSCLDSAEEGAPIFPYPKTTYNYLSLTSTEYIRNILHFLRDLLAKYGMEQLPIIATEWNITFYLIDLIRDTAFLAPYIVHTSIQTLGCAEGLSYFALSDINDQSRSSPLPFPGGSGLFDRHSIPKPAYYALWMLHQLDDKVLSTGDSYVITGGKNSYHILIYNLAEYDKDLHRSHLEFMSETHRYQVFQTTDTISFHGVFAVEEGTWQIKKFRLDRERGSAFDAWQKMGSPTDLTEDICRYLRQMSLPALTMEVSGNTASLTLEDEVPPHGVLLMELTRIGSD